MKPTYEKDIGRMPNRRRITTVLFIFALTYITIVNMISFVNDKTWNFPLIPLTKGSIAVMALICIIALMIILSRKFPIFLLIILLFAFVSIISTLLNYKTQGSNLINSVIFQFFWVSSFIIIYYVSNKKNRSFINTVLIITFPIVFVVYIYLYSNLERVNGFNLVYYLLLYLPFIFNYRRSFNKIILMLLVFIAVLLSMKRLAFIAFILSLIIYYLVDHFVSGNKRGKYFYTIISLPPLIYTGMLIYNFTTQNFNLNIFSRFMNLDEDGGSGRNIIYEAVWSKQLNSSIGEWILGRGYNGVSLTSVASSSAAHNDFLEVLFDYGLIGFLLYIIFWIILINYNVKLIKTKSDLAAPFASSLIIFMLLSLFSVLIIYPRYFLYLVIFWALSFSDGKKRN